MFVAQDTFFRKKKLLNCRGRLLDLSGRAVMGILNLTPDSFYDKSRLAATADAVRRAGEMLGQGASILDLGAQSTRPGAELLPADVEWNRLSTSLTAIRKEFPSAFISIDTFHASVAVQALDMGADLINDISGGSLDPGMLEIPARYNAPYILMHLKGTPKSMQKAPHYEDVTAEVLSYFSERLALLRSKGAHDVILDPGFGFGKTLEHNFTLLKNLELFALLECPVMAGLSRKSMVNKILNVQPEDALNGSTVLHTIALLKGVDILRVHDVKEAVEVVKLVSAVQS